MTIDGKGRKNTTVAHDPFDPSSSIQSCSRCDQLRILHQERTPRPLGIVCGLRGGVRGRGALGVPTQRLPIKEKRHATSQSSSLQELCHTKKYPRQPSWKPRLHLKDQMLGMVDICGVGGTYRRGSITPSEYMGVESSQSASPPGCLPHLPYLRVNCSGMYRG